MLQTCLDLYVPCDVMMDIVTGQYQQEVILGMRKEIKMEGHKHSTQYTQNVAYFYIAMNLL